MNERYFELLDNILAAKSKSELDAIVNTVGPIINSGANFTECYASDNSSPATIGAAWSRVHDLITVKSYALMYKEIESICIRGLL